MTPEEILTELEEGTPASTPEVVAVIPITVSRHLVPFARRLLNLIHRSAGDRVTLPGDRLFFLARSEIRSRANDAIRQRDRRRSR